MKEKKPQPKPNNKPQKQETTSETKAAKISFEKLKSVYLYNIFTTYNIFIITNIKYYWDKAEEVEVEFRNTDAMQKQSWFLDFFFF